MPTVKRIRNWRVSIYLNDHPPPHVHVRGPDWEVEVWLDPMSVKDYDDCSERQAWQVLQAVAPHRHELIRRWKEIHA